MVTRQTGNPSPPPPPPPAGGGGRESTVENKLTRWRRCRGGGEGHGDGEGVLDCDEHGASRGVQCQNRGRFLQGNPFTTTMMSLESDQHKREMGNLSAFLPPLFALACERTFITMHGTESRCVIGPENRLFAGPSLHLSAQKLYTLRQ